MTFAQKSMNEKSNEIHAVRELLKQLEISGCMVVANAWSCQKKTAREVIVGNTDYLLCKRITKEP